MDRFGNTIINFLFGSFERTRGTIIFVCVIASIFWILNHQVVIVDFFNKIIDFLYHVLAPFAIWVGILIFCLQLGFSYITKPFRSGKKK